MPPAATHLAGTLFLYEDRLKIAAGRFHAAHRRRLKGEPPAPLPEHRSAKIAAVHGSRAKLYEKRGQLLNLGAPGPGAAHEITHDTPKLARHRVEELYRLLEQYGDDAMRSAIARAVEGGQLSVAGVRRALPTRAGVCDGARRRGRSKIDRLLRSIMSRKGERVRARGSRSGLTLRGRADRCRARTCGRSGRRRRGSGRSP